MNGLEFILILLVPLGVWILSSIFKSDDERPAGRAANGNRSPVQRRPVTDLERFLEEARRRREMAGGRQQASPEPPRPAPQRERRPTPLPEQRQRVPQQPPRRRQVEGPAPRTNRPPVLLEAVPEALPVVTPVARGEAVRVEATVEPVASAAAMPVAAPTPPRPAPRITTSPAVRHLAALLRSPQTAGTAIVLREVFDQPLCRRRR
jgi:hypothetical protein